MGAACAALPAQNVDLLLLPQHLRLQPRHLLLQVVDIRGADKWLLLCKASLELLVELLTDLGDVHACGGDAKLPCSDREEQLHVILLLQ